MKAKCIAVFSEFRNTGDDRRTAHLKTYEPIKFLLQSIFEEFSVLDQIEVGCSIHLLV